MFFDKHMEQNVETIERHGSEVEFRCFWSGRPTGDGNAEIGLEVTGNGWNRYLTFDWIEDMEDYVHSFHFAQTAGQIRDWVLDSRMPYGKVY